MTPVYRSHFFSETVKPSFLPNINLVCASIAGRLPKIIKVTGKKAHCTTMERFCHHGNLAGFLGSRKKLKIAENSTPIIAVVIKNSNVNGVLANKALFLKSWPATYNGRRPKIKIKIGAVAQEYIPSIKLNPYLNFLPILILLLP